MIICHLHHLRSWTYGICQHLLTDCAAGCTVDPIQTCLHSFGRLTPFLSRMTRYYLCSSSFPFWVATSNISVNWRIQFRKHLISLPVTGYPQRLYPCLSWGPIQPPQDLALYPVLQVSACNSTLPSHLFCHWVPVYKIPPLSSVKRNLCLLKSLSSLTSFTVQIYKFIFAQPKHVRCFPLLFL